MLHVRHQTLQTMTSVLAPVLPYLAEEIHEHRAAEPSGRSFFTNKWEPLVRPFIQIHK